MLEELHSIDHLGRVKKLRQVQLRLFIFLFYDMSAFKTLTWHVSLPSCPAHSMLSSSRPALPVSLHCCKPTSGTQTYRRSVEITPPVNIDNN